MGKRIIHPNSLANLRPQKAGEPSHNPKGPPKKVDSLLECIREEMGKPSINPALTNEQLIASMLVAQATKGNLKAADMLMEYTIVKPHADVNVTTNGKQELIVRWDGNRNLPGSAPPATN